jgi:hypothetical protein
MIYLTLFIVQKHYEYNLILLKIRHFIQKSTLISFWTGAYNTTKQRHARVPALSTAHRYLRSMFKLTGNSLSGAILKLRTR